MRTTNLDGNSIFVLKSDQYVTAITKEEYDAMSLSEHEARIRLEWVEVSRTTERHRAEEEDTSVAA